MITLRKSEARGYADHGWLQSHHTFSFANYYDPAHMNFRVLRVINEDYIQQGKGFGTHSHRDMEIITYVLEGALEHKDSMGNTSVINAGEVQKLSAGTGITHSEFNHSATELAHILQIWILPDLNGITPSYAQQKFSDRDKENQLKLVVSKDGRNSSIAVQQDVNIYACIITDSLSYINNRYTWLHVARGHIKFGEFDLKAGDAAAINSPETLNISGDGEILIFDLP